MDLNFLLAFRIDPAAKDAAAGKYKRMGLASFDNGEFEITVKRGG